MTKLRPPLSIENALMKVLGSITIEVAANVTGRKEHYLRDLTDPDKRAQLTVIDAIKLDLAHRLAGQPGAPLYETIGLILRSTDAEIFSDAVQLGNVAVRVIREGGEAHAALCAASRPGASLAQLQDTLREIEESIGEHAKAVAHLQAMIQHRTQQPP